MAIRHAETTWLRGRCAWGVAGIEAVHVQGDIDRTGAQDLAHARDRIFSAHHFELVVADYGEAEAAAAAGIVRTELGAAQTQLDDAFGFQEALLGRAPERRGVVDPGPVELVGSGGMSRPAIVAVNYVVRERGVIGVVRASRRDG